MATGASVRSPQAGGVSRAECFDEAALRHFRDGGILQGAQSPANADHLFGLAAECAIKYALVGLPGGSASGRLVEKYRKHIDVLWDRASIQGNQRLFPALLTLLKRPNPFADWSVDQRYGAEGAILEGAPARHQDEARRLLGSVRLLGARKRG